MSLKQYGSITEYLQPWFVFHCYSKDPDQGPCGQEGIPWLICPDHGLLMREARARECCLLASSPLLFHACFLYRNSGPPVQGWQKGPPTLITDQENTLQTCLQGNLLCSNQVTLFVPRNPIV